MSTEHWSDCAVNNEPYLPAGECDCGGYDPADAVVLDVPGQSCGVDKDGVEWLRIPSEAYWGQSAPRVWALMLKKHQKKLKNA